MRNTNLTIIAAFLLVLLGVVAHAQTAGFECDAVTYGYDYSGVGGGYVFGYAFTVSSDIQVTALGVFDDEGDGLGASHEVVIWNNGDPGTMVVSAVVAQGTGEDLVGHFRYHYITPTTLLASHTYVIGTSAEGDLTAVNHSNPVWGPGITFNEIRYADGSTTTVYPGIVAPSNWASPIYAGAGFLYKAVPEPSALAGLLAGVTSLLGMGFVRSKSARCK